MNLPCSASRGEIQTEIDRLAPVMGERLIGRREREKEPGVEPLRQKGRRDPVGERDETVDRGREVLPGQKLGEGDGPVEPASALGRNEPGFARRPCEEDAAFLERLADGGDAKPESGIVVAERGGKLQVRRLHPPAGEHQRAGGEVDLDDGAPP